MSYSKQHDLHLIKRETTEVLSTKNTQIKQKKNNIQNEEIIISYPSIIKEKTIVAPTQIGHRALHFVQQQKNITQTCFKTPTITKETVKDDIIGTKKGYRLSLLLMIIGLICLAFMPLLGLTSFFTGLGILIVSLFREAKEKNTSEKTDSTKAAKTNKFLLYLGFAAIIAAALISVLTIDFLIAGILLAAGALLIFIGLCMAYGIKDKALETLSLILLLIGGFIGFLTLLVLLIRNISLEGNSAYF